MVWGQATPSPASPPGSVPLFIAGQLAGGLAGVATFGWLLAGTPRASA